MGFLKYFSHNQKIFEETPYALFQMKILYFYLDCFLNISITGSLRGGGGSSVRMNLSHGRSKSVLIETKRKKIILTNKNNPSQNQKEKNAFKLEDSNKTNEKVFTEEEIDRRKKAIEAAREREILLKEEQEKLKKE